MNKLCIGDLLSLEQYHEQRKTFRERLRQHKAERRLAVGSHVSLYFEDLLTMKYQIQEMLYAEKIIDKAEIQEELDTYNPIIPDGDNFKATMMLEYTDVEERKNAVVTLVGIEHKVYVAIEGFDKVYAIADEDLEHADTSRTASVHFLRFQFNEAMVTALKNETKFFIGIDHPEYTFETHPIPQQCIEQLLGDLDI